MKIIKSKTITWNVTIMKDCPQDIKTKEEFKFWGDKLLSGEYKTDVEIRFKFNSKYKKSKKQLMKKFDKLSNRIKEKIAEVK